MNEGEDTPIEALSTGDSAATDMKRKTKAKHHHLQRNQRTCDTTGSSELKESMLHNKRNNPSKIMLEQIMIEWQIHARQFVLVANKTDSIFALRELMKEHRR